MNIRERAVEALIPIARRLPLSLPQKLTTTTTTVALFNYSYGKCTKSRHQQCRLECCKLKDSRLALFQAAQWLLMPSHGLQQVSVQSRQVGPSKALRLVSLASIVSYLEKPVRLLQAHQVASTTSAG